MKFEEALENFKNEIAKQYGIENGIVKIGITPDLMDVVTGDLYKSGNMYRFSPSQFGELKLNGVQLLPRRKDDF